MLVLVVWILFSETDLGKVPPMDSFFIGKAMNSPG